MPDKTPTAGATPAAADATSAQTATDTGQSAPATGSDDTDAQAQAALGDPGKRAIDRMAAERDAANARAKATQKELDDLKAAGLSESEKAIEQAKKAGNAEATTRYHAAIRRAEVKAALAAAGINAGVLDLAVRADEFAALKVTDDGDVTGLSEAVEAFKKARSDLFKAPVPAGTADGGARGGSGATFTREQIEKMTPAEHAKNRDAIFAWLGAQK